MLMLILLLQLQLVIFRLVVEAYWNPEVPTHLISTIIAYHSLVFPNIIIIILESYHDVERPLLSTYYEVHFLTGIIIIIIIIINDKNNNIVIIIIIIISSSSSSSSSPLPLLSLSSSKSYFTIFEKVSTSTWTRSYYQRPSSICY